MLSRIVDWFTPDPKLWKVDEHRVRKKDAYKEITLDGPPYFDTVKCGEVFECVDCEKKFDDRESFKDEECYEVIS